MSETAARRAHRMRAPRRVALLGGTTKLADCWVALAYLLNPARLVRGPVIVEYEQAFAQQVGVRFGYSFRHGRVGLYGILRALGIRDGDDVLLPAPTHIVVPNAIRYVGARPIYVDCRLDTYDMDLEQAEERITPRTKALILQHTFGIPADLDRALSLAERHGLALIEDCVHALGASYGGQQVGSFGRAAFFSTEETKTISTTLGGMVVTDDAELAERIRAFQESCEWSAPTLVARYLLKLVVYHLLTEPHLHFYARALYEAVGRRQPLPRPTTGDELRGERPAHYEQRFSNAQAALGLRQLRRLESNLAHRRAVAQTYAARLSERGHTVPQWPAKADPAFVRYPVWVKDRAATVSSVAPHAVLGTWFTSVLEEAVSLAAGEYETGACPRAEAAARHLVNLPTHPRVGAADVEAIVSAMGSAAV